MSRPDPIEYAERLYAAIRDANFSPIAFLAFGNAIKDGVALRNMPRIAIEPFMQVVGEMLNLEEEAAAIDAEMVSPTSGSAPGGVSQVEVTENLAQVTAPQGSPPGAETVALVSPPLNRRARSKRA